MVRKGNLFLLFEVRIEVDRWVKVEENGEIQRLIRVQQLVFEAEALNFVEVHGTLLGENLVDRDASDRLVRPIVHFIKGQGCLTGIDEELWRLR